MKLRVASPKNVAVCLALTVAVVAAPVALSSATADSQASIAKKKCKKKKCKKKKKKPGSGGEPVNGDPAALTFTSGGGFATRPVSAGPQERAYTFTNVGGQTSGPVTATVQNGTPAGFTLASNGCAGGVAGGASCDVIVRFTPSTPGTGYSGMLTVSASPGGIASSTLSATTTVGG